MVSTSQVKWQDEEKGEHKSSGNDGNDKWQ